MKKLLLLTLFMLLYPLTVQAGCQWNSGDWNNNGWDFCNDPVTGGGGGTPVAVDSNVVSEEEEPAPLLSIIPSMKDSGMFSFQDVKDFIQQNKVAVAVGTLLLVLLVYSPARIFLFKTVGNTFRFIPVTFKAILGMGIIGIGILIVVIIIAVIWAKQYF